MKDPMAVGVDRRREAIAANEPAEEQEVAVRIFLQAEDPAEDSAGGVIDGGVEDESWPTVFEPGVVAAVHLDEEAGLGHAVPAAAMAGWATGAGAANPRGAEEPLHGLAGEPEALALPEQLGEVMIVHARIGGAG